MRLALWSSQLGRDGPGLLLRDIRAARADVLAARDLIARARPDVLLLLHFDHDHQLAALGAFQALLAEGGHPMPHAHAPPPNTGLPSGIDLDGDGRLGRHDDAQGFGRFQGAAGMALLSRLPLGAGLDHTDFLWRDLPGSLIPLRDGAPFPSAQAHAVQRLSSTGHWEVPVELPGGGRLTLLAWHAGPPAFGAVPGRNLARNHDETAFWLRRLEGGLPLPPLAGPVVAIGNPNQDPDRGDGMRAAIQGLLDHPRLQDPRPRGPPPAGHADWPPQATAAFAPPPRGPGPLRTGYILPDAGLRVAEAGLIWPDPPGRYALVWVDVEVPE